MARSKAKKPIVIQFIAEVVRVETRDDHAIRLTLDMPESESKALADLIRTYQQGMILECACVAIDPDASP